MKTLLFLLILILTFSCAKRTGLKFVDDATVEATRRREALEIEAREKARFEEEKKQTWANIVSDARESFKTIQPLIDRKCFACHDTKTPVPFYGRVFSSRNPINLHRLNGIKALDFSTQFPFAALGNPPQLSILKSFRTAVLDRTMPLKSYRTIFPGKKIFKADEELITAWIDPLIERLEDYELRFTPQPRNATAQTRKIFEQKCFRCHANGNDRGGFGSMENPEAILSSRYITRLIADTSLLFQTIENGKMPPDPREALTQDELISVRDWIEKKE